MLVEDRHREMPGERRSDPHGENGDCFGTQNVPRNDIHGFSNNIGIPYGTPT
jgi:hypothetical protein